MQISKDTLNTAALYLCFVSSFLPITQAAEPIMIAMNADHWQTKENTEFLRELGFFHGVMRLNSGMRYSKTWRSAREPSSST